MSYEVRPGSIDTAGPDFELGHLQLLFFKYGFSGCDFSLLRNVDQLGALDDIVLSVRNDEPYSIVFQVKFKRNGAINREILFKTKPQAKHFIDIKKLFTSVPAVETYCNQHPDLMVGGFEKCSIVFLTNVTINDDIRSLVKSENIPENVSILNTSLNDPSIFQFDCTNEEVFSLDLREIGIDESKRKKTATKKQEDELLQEIGKDLHPLVDLYKTLANSSQVSEESVISRIQTCVHDLDVHRKLIDRTSRWVLYKRSESSSPKSVGRDKAEVFLNKFYLLTDQSVSDSLTDNIVSIIQEHFPRINAQKLLAMSKEQLVRKSNFSKSNIITAETFNEQVSGFIYNQLHEIHLGWEYKINVEFNQTSVKELEDLFHQQTITKLVCKPNEYELLKSRIKSFVADPTRRTIFINATDLNEYEKEIKWLWKHQKEGTIFVIMEDTEIKIEVPSQVKHVIIYHKLSDTTQPHYLETNLNHLSKSSYNDIVKKNIMFQGSTIAFGEIIQHDESFKCHVKGHTLSRLIKDHLHFGIQLETESHFISRNLNVENHHAEIIDFFNTCEGNGNIYFLSQLKCSLESFCARANKKMEQDQRARYRKERNDEGKLSMETEIVQIGNRKVCLTLFNHFYILFQEEDLSDRDLNVVFSEVIKRNLDKSVHWFHHIDSEVIWKQSYGKRLRYKKSKVVPKEYTYVDQVQDVPEFYVPIQAEPGMGKSTLLRYWASEFKKKQPSCLVVFINLIEIQIQLKTLDFHSVDDLVTVVGSSMLDEHEEFSQILKYLLTTEGRSIAFLDGLDEVCPFHYDKAVRLINGFKTFTKVSKLIVSSRISFDAGIKSPVYRLRPFDKKDQINFLTYYCRQYNNGVSDTQILAFVSKVLELFQSQLQPEELDLLGMPLQTNMLATIFCHNIKERTDDYEMRKELSLLSFFELFINRKVEILLFEKWNCSSREPEFRQKELEKNRTQILEVGSELAVYTLFKDMPDCPVNIKLQEIEEMAKKLQKYGLVSKISLEEEVSFVHKTITEYLCAVFFVRKYKDQLKFIYEHSKEFAVVRMFFNLLLAQDCPALTAIILNNKHFLEEFIDEKELLIVDAGGRNIFHIACLYARKDIVQHLIRKLKNTSDLMNQEDRVLNSKPAQYCFRHLPLCWEVFSMSFDFIREDLKEFDLLDDDEKMIGIKFCIENKHTSLFSVLSPKCSHFNFFPMLKDNLLDLQLVDSTLTKNDIGFISLLDYVAFKGNLSILKEMKDIITYNKNKAIFLAYLNKHLDCVDYLVTDSEDLQYVTEYKKNNIIHVLVKLNKFKPLKHLIEKYQIDVNMKNRYMETPLMIAAERASPRLFKYLLSKNASIHDVDEDGNNLLHFACRSKNKEIVERLVKEGIDLNSQGGHYKQTPLMRAAWYSSTEVVEFLLQQNVELNVTDHYGDNALHYACRRFRNKCMINRLVDAGIEINVYGKSQQTPLMIAREYQSGDNSEAVNFLLSRGAKE